MISGTPRRASPGAIIAAAVAVVGFDVRGWYGVNEFYPHALVGVSRRDIAIRGNAAADRRERNRVEGKMNTRSNAPIKPNLHDITCTFISYSRKP